MLNLERKIWVIIGTRPELIKQLPVYYQCIKKFGKKNVVLVNSGQHKNFLNFYSKENQVKFDLILNKLQSTKSLIKNIKESIKAFYIIYIFLNESVPGHTKMYQNISKCI